MSRNDPGAGATADDQLSDALGRARRGSGEALRELYDSLSPQLAGYLRVRGAADVDAATNEVFHRAFDRLDRFKGTASGFRSWIFTIANNLLIDEHRKRIRRPNVVASVDPNRHDVTGGDVEEEAVSNLRTAEIDRLLATLTPNQRDVLVLRIIAGLTLAETADVLGRPLGAVKSLQHRAVEVLRYNFAKSPVSPNAIGTF